jgi:hypothetical protein
VFVSSARRGASAGAEARRLLERLRAAGPQAETRSLGDASLLPRELALVPLSDVARTFGGALTAGLDDLVVGEWGGPLESAYGLHLVLLNERVASPRPTLARVRPQVEREVLAERQRQRLEALYERMLEKYTVTFETPASPRPANGRAP